MKLRLGRAAAVEGHPMRMRGEVAFQEAARDASNQRGPRKHGIRASPYASIPRLLNYDPCFPYGILCIAHKELDPLRGAHSTAQHSTAQHLFSTRPTRLVQAVRAWPLGTRRFDTMQYRRRHGCCRADFPEPKTVQCRRVKLELYVSMRLHGA
jgi:hypothetical protein